MLYSPAEPIVLGCHHKTGTHLLTPLIRAASDEFWDRRNVVWGRPDQRKLPLSKIVEGYNRWFCYLNIWFEHEVDVPECSIRFLQFVRHPAKWVRSAFLYHKKGGPSEGTPWLKWRIFRISDRNVSYQELLNGLDEERGLMIEAIRCFPEIAGTSRSARSATSVRMRHQVTLEDFEHDFEGTLRAACRSLG